MAKTAHSPLPLGRGKIGFKVANTLAAPASKVWAAITQARHTQSYFVGKVTGDFTARLEPVTWYWKRWGRMSQWPTVFQKEQKLEFVWEDHTKTYLTTVTFSLKKKGKLVELEIHERGWTQAHLKNAFSNCEGWTTYLAYLKAYLQENVDLRTDKK